MNIEPLVSVLMPAYNAERYISAAIESILIQTYTNFEFIICDDASKDSTWHIIQKFAKQDSRIISIRNKENLYIAGNRNKLLSLAKGEFIVWMDADDISLPTRIEKEINLMLSDKNLGIVGGYLQFFNDENSTTTIRKYSQSDADLRKSIFRFSPVAQPGCMIRKEAIEYVGNSYDLNTPPAEDLDMSFRIGTKYKFGNIPEIVIKYRENPNSATFTKLKKIETTTINIRRKYFNHPSYKATVVDKLYNLAQYVSIFIIPTKFKIKLFNLIRNTK